MRSRTCEGCDEEMDADRRLRRSLYARIATHAARHGTPLALYRQRYGLDTEAVLTWWKRKIATGLLDCGCAVGDMRHGTKDVELHQLNPSEPFFPETWQLVCVPDHRSMGREDYPAYKRGWALWVERHRPTGQPVE
jgi:hypothetical protein